MSLVPTDEEIEAKARELTDKDGPGWAAVVSEEHTQLETGTKGYWLKMAEGVLRAERRYAL
ncbi:hypothetical protein SAMN02927923_03265 [Microvirga guangxiensis]|uniref:Uncharacterized protein n=1 Tax=Microvirga guangxiensis TaxID=549386 RepID=A0A1G5KEI8_9HYPH|nr:hypothetical protein SAMN02927923_03265 [Microvirga guangxiensis]